MDWTTHILGSTLPLYFIDKAYLATIKLMLSKMIDMSIMYIAQDNISSIRYDRVHMSYTI